MEIISYKQAKALGLKKYFVEPCHAGHVDGFYVSTQHCCECHRIWARNSRARDPEQTKEVNRRAAAAARKRDPERVRRNWRNWAARQKAMINGRAGKPAKPSETKPEGNQAGP